MHRQILFIFGPSGVGKSTLAEWVIEDLDFLHFNFDNWDGKGIDAKVIKPEFKEYRKTHEALNLSEAISREVALQNKKGAVVTFPSHHLLSVKHIQQAEKCGIRTVILIASKEACTDSFLKREKEIERHLDLNHWNRFNGCYFDGAFPQELIPYTVEAFKNGNRRSRESLVQEVRARIAREYAEPLS